jgi:NAD(P)-dependent dehydrogenase (short-subunit alcohol dehydrogenase family)
MGQREKHRGRHPPYTGRMAGMDLGLDGRVYLVTGGSRGLGFAAAQALVADGARVMLSAPREASAASAVARLAPAEYACVLWEHLRFGHLAVMSGSRA